MGIKSVLAGLLSVYANTAYAHDVAPILKTNTSELQALAESYVQAAPKDRQSIIQKIEEKAQARYTLLSHLYVHQPMNLSAVLSDVAMPLTLRNRLTAITRTIERKLERRGAQADGYLHVRIERLNKPNAQGKMLNEKFFVHSSTKLDSSSLPAQVLGYSLHSNQGLSKVSVRNAIEVIAENGRSVLAFDKNGSSGQIVFGGGPGGGQGGGGSTGGSPVTGTRKALVVIGHFLDTPELPETPEQIAARMFSNADSLNTFMQDSSYKKLTFSGDVTPWITIGKNVNGDCSDDAWIDEAGRKASQLGFNTSNYNHIIYMFVASYGQSTSRISHSCPFAGWGYMPGSVTINLGSVSSSTYYNFPLGTIRHEVGHNLGLHHANFYDCGNMMIDGTCNDLEYGDYSSEMGSQGLFNAPERVSMGWMDSTQMQSVTSAGRFELTPLSAIGSSLKILKIPRGSGDPLYISYRRGGASGGPFEWRLEGASVHFWSGSRSTYTHVIDTRPNSSSNELNDAALEDGRRFEDLRNNITITQVSHSDASVVLDVSFDPITCIDKPLEFRPNVGSALLKPGESLYSSYKVYNPSSLKCNSKSVSSITASIPSGFTLKTTVPTSLTVLPQQEISIPFTVTASTTTPAGTYYPGLVFDGQTVSVPTTVITDSDRPTTPANLKAIQVGATIVLTWDPSTDSNGISRYQVFKNIPGVTTTSYTSYKTEFIDSYSLVGGVTYSYYVIAIDNFGKSSYQTPMVYITYSAVPDTEAPSLQITSPLNGSTVYGQILLTATATDNIGVSRVDFYVDGVLLGSDSTSPYSWSYNTANHANSAAVVTAMAYDAVGNSTRVDSSVMVNNPVLDTTAPSVQITSPAAGTALSGVVSIAANASDNVGVAYVEFQVDGVRIGSDSSSPYSLNYDTKTHANGGAVIKAIAVDMSGNQSESVVSVSINNVADSTPPTVAMITPTDGSSVSARQIITLSASAQDNIGVSYVEFYVNGALKCSSTSASSTFACNWKTPGKRGVRLEIKARALDTAGNASWSVPVSVISQ